MPDPDALTTALLVHVGDDPALRPIVAQLAAAALRVAGGDPARVEAWFTGEHLRAFHGRRPWEVVRDGHGGRLLDFVESLAGGALG
jgi:hypothetical protein